LGFLAKQTPRFWVDRAILQWIQRSTEPSGSQ
jgi:hypothetical protein